MNKSTNISPFLSLFMFGVIAAMGLFFFLSSRSSTFGDALFIISLIPVACAFGIGWYARKKFPPKSSTNLRIFVIIMIAMVLIVVGAGYRLVINHSASNFFLFIIVFGCLINSIQQYMKKRKATSILPNNKKEIL